MLIQKRKNLVHEVDNQVASNLKLIYQNGGMYLTKEGVKWLEKIATEVKK
jgi:hypothetical protein